MLEQFKIMYFNNYKIPYPPIHDPLTIFYILHPEEIEMCKTYIEVDTGDKSYGRTNCYFQGPRNPNIDKESVNWVATNLKNDKVKFWDEMLKILDHIFS
jgi:inosine-uridine nucleoside N-ribohydrolase